MTRIVAKKKIILLRSKSLSNVTKHLNFKISNQYIERISEVKHLGRILNEFLNCNTHFALLKKKLKPAI